MIIEQVLILIWVVIKSVFSLVPDLPAFPTSLDTSVNLALNTIFSATSLVDCFIRPSTIKIMIPIIIIVWNFDYIYSISMWIFKKIPFFGVN